MHYNQESESKNLKSINEKFWNVLCNVVIPVTFLIKFTDEHNLESFLGLMLALLAPLFYGSYDLVVNKKNNRISVFATTCVVLTGTWAHLGFDVQSFVVKEAAIPILIAFGVVISLKKKDATV